MMLALDNLCLMAEIAANPCRGTRRPTWAPPLVLDGELVSVLRELGYLKPADKNVARLWARFRKPESGIVTCHGFELRAGQLRNGKRFFETMRSAAAWSSGPKWRPWPTPTAAQQARFDLLVRAVELAAIRVSDFAGRPHEQMQIGGVLTGSCAVCGRGLLDPISLERGIGPECWGGFRL